MASKFLSGSTPIIQNSSKAIAQNAGNYNMNVTFSNAFASVPNVVVTVFNSTAPAALYGVVLTSVTTTGFVGTVVNYWGGTSAGPNNLANCYIEWIAVTQ